MFLYKIAGLFFVGLAILGAVLPLLPTTPFLLVAAACFAKSSPYLYRKLIENKLFGPMILNWQEHRAISKKSKRIALISIGLAVAWSLYILPNIWLKLATVSLVIWPIWFIYRLPELD